MKLGDFLSDAPEAPTFPVTFQIVGKNKQGVQIRKEARAALVFVDDETRLKCRRDAREYITAQGGHVADDLQHEIAYFFLHHALRDADDPRTPFAPDVGALRKALVRLEADRLIVAHDEWVRAEFPDTVTQKALRDIEAEAEGK